jgi:hypothetical protein
VRAGRRYYVRQMLEYVDQLEVPQRVRAYMKRVIARGYDDVALANASPEAALEFRDLTR